MEGYYVGRSRAGLWRIADEPLQCDTAMRRLLGASLAAGLRRAPVVLVALAACHRSPPPRPPIAQGMIAGLIRDAVSGEAVENAIVAIRRPGELATQRHRSDVNGAFMIPALPPGHYDVVAYVDALAIGASGADVRPGEVVGLDFTVGHVDATPDLNAPGAPALWRYRPRDADPLTGVIEGTVADIHNLRLPAAVVSVTVTGTIETQQTVTDAQGRFAVRDLAPGSYDVSAYYAVVRRGQIEVRRSRVIVAGGEAVVVPLWLDTDGR